MRNKLVIIPFLLAALLSCKSSTSQNQTGMEKQRVGHDTDEHGCLRSAGYTWSVLKNECIRPFELEIKFTNSQDSTQGGNLVFSEDKARAEFFGVGPEPSLLLTKKETTTYESSNGQYVLRQHANNHWTLVEKIDNKETLLFELDK